VRHAEKTGIPDRDIDIVDTCLRAALQQPGAANPVSNEHPGGIEYPSSNRHPDDNCHPGGIKYPGYTSRLDRDFAGG
jgi:hypothetical protein